MNITGYFTKNIDELPCCAKMYMTFIMGLIFFFISSAFPVLSQGIDDEKDIAIDSTEVLSVDF